jgi:tetratricopeptide (TPR) repeat protein
MSAKTKAPKKSFRLLIPNATVFIASFCIMVIELIAGRIIARYMGVSLYTWTSVIGVVLAGISFGSYLGGKIADRFEAKRAISRLFILASLTCVFIPILNNLLANFYIFLELSLPVRITIHVLIIFFLPSCVLGMISPVVAKSALGQGFKTGKTIGNIYAWAAAGSIAGTFITGFWLIAYLGVIAVIAIVASILMVSGIVYGYYAKKNLVSFSVITITILLIFGLMGSFAFAKRTESDADVKTVYEKDSRYFYIKITQRQDKSVVRKLILDTLVHSQVLMNEPANIDFSGQYGYLKIYSALTHYLTKGKQDSSFLVLGGGGYVFPRYLQKAYPKSRIDVVEIDPAVTEAAILALGLPKEHAFKIYHADARNYIDDLIRLRNRADKISQFDLVYCDAINDFSVPYQLVTYEFNEKIKQVLRSEGVYLLHVVDYLSCGRFLGALLNTLEKSFSYVYVVPTKVGRLSPNFRNGFAIVCSGKAIDMRGIFGSELIGFQALNQEKINWLKEHSGGISLTDNYAPVENLLAPVFRLAELNSVSDRLADRGNKFLAMGDFNKAIKYYKKSSHLNPDYTKGYFNLGSLLARQGRLEEALKFYKKVLELEPEFAEVHYCLGNLFLIRGEFEEAIKEFNQALEIDPELTEARDRLDIVLKEREGRKR